MDSIEESNRLRLEAINILLEIKKQINDEDDFVWTSYENAEELRNDIDRYVDDFVAGSVAVLDEVYSHFLVTSTFQELSISNGWSAKYMKLAEQFDKLYLKLKE